MLARLKTGGVAVVLGLAVTVGFSPAAARADTDFSVTYEDGQYSLNNISGDTRTINGIVPVDGGVDQMFHGFILCLSQTLGPGGSCPLYLNGESGTLSVGADEIEYADDVFVPAAS